VTDEQTHSTTLTLENLIESLLLVADEPVPVSQLAAALDTRPQQVKTALLKLEESYHDRGLQLQQSSGGIQLTSHPLAAATIEHFLGLESQQRLSSASLETLAIVAYSQPVTRPQIDGVRGVNSDSVLKNLLFKGLIEEVGRSEGLGRPILYGTSSAFLQHFGLASLNELPPLEQEEQEPDSSREPTQETIKQPDYQPRPLPKNGA
jgi:segregation and condensation protein B